MKILFRLLLITLTLNSVRVNADIIVIGHHDIGTLSTSMVNRIYTGRVIEVKGVSLEPINMKPGSSLRDKFLQKYLEQDEDKYAAYWTVRRFIGKGTPPKELETVNDIIEYVRNNKGAIGYIEDNATELPEGIFKLNE